MRRHSIEPRENWERIVAAQGLTYHSVEGRPYWDESAYWEFSAAEIDRLEAATTELQRMCLAAGERVVREGRFASMHIPEVAAAAIRRTWEAEPPALYGRMDLAYDGHSIKLLEYNADTPTSLIEASVVQWHWLRARFPGGDQWNSLHERLVAKWQDLRPYLGEPVYFAHDGWEEDLLTVTYLRDTARQAGVSSKVLRVNEVGWDAGRRCFVDLERAPIRSIFKLYPWETLLREPFGIHALETMTQGHRAESGHTQWMEPIWKMLWSNKALLAVLWEMYAGHELLLPAYLDGPRQMDSYVRKPLLGREGANVRVVDAARSEETGGRYAQGPWVYQGLAPVPCVEGNWIVLGSWLVDGEAAGMGIREGKGRVIRNVDRFVPHLFSP